MDLTTEQALNIAINAHQQGNLAQAKQIYVAVLKSEPANPHALNYLGLIHLNEGQVDSALQLLSQSLQSNPNNADAVNNLGLAHFVKGNTDTAIECYQLALRLVPDFQQALLNLGGCFLKKQEYDTAKSYFHKLLKLNPDQASALSNLGMIAKQQQDFGTALSYYERAYDLEPKNEFVLINLGQLHFSRGEPEKALAYYDRAINVSPNSAQAHFNRATVNLCLGNFMQGWQDYEWRIMNRAGRRYLLNPLTQAQLPRPSEILPLSLEKRKVLLLGDQGIGDELFFLRFVPRLISLGATCSFLPSDKLLPLLRRWGLVDLIEEHKMDPETDYVFSVCELPLVTGMCNEQDIPSSLRLDPSAEELSRVQSLYGHLPKPWLGITWEAGTKEGTLLQLFKSVPLTKLLRSIGDWPGTVFIVQRNPNPEDVSRVFDRFTERAVDASVMNDDLEFALALLSELDDYIGVSNTNMHLTAMLGKTAKVLVPLNAEFRWMSNVKESPWFPGFGVYRESRETGWDSAMAAIESDLSSD